MVVLITGCSSGIGRATALHLVKAGHTVYATARKVEALTDLKAAGCRVLPLDVCDEQSMVAAVAAIEGEAGTVEVLVNNAGYSRSGAVESVPVADVRRQFETNVFGLLRLTQLCLPGMRRRGAGRVINVGSMGGTLTFPGGGVYHASKYALEALSDALRFEVKGFGVKVVLIQPGLIKTGFAEAVGSHMQAAPGDTKGDIKGDPYAAFNAAVLKSIQEVYEVGPLAKLGGTPEQVAQVIARAIDAPAPKARYTVTWSATMLMSLRQALPDGVWDMFLSGNFPRPGAR